MEIGQKRRNFSIQLFANEFCIAGALHWVSTCCRYFEKRIARVVRVYPEKMVCVRRLEDAFFARYVGGTGVCVVSFCRCIKDVSVCLIVQDTALMKRQKTLSDSDKWPVYLNGKFDAEFESAIRIGVRRMRAEIMTDFRFRLCTEPDFQCPSYVFSRLLKKYALFVNTTWIGIVDTCLIYSFWKFQVSRWNHWRDIYWDAWRHVYAKR